MQIALRAHSSVQLTHTQNVENHERNQLIKENKKEQQNSHLINGITNEDYDTDVIEMKECLWTWIILEAVRSSYRCITCTRFYYPFIAIMEFLGLINRSNWTIPLLTVFTDPTI
ncbi:unnamed protein product [Cercopithifilaria johnstoni]|uniref:Uncharacterized protein n=1 Tax=Cercopithifilaria johnstoni TaxID=2874296 RepID=A0A8J2Q0K4_9BILA|nr:unnamed protein product [Cercopithifilaria johnstoni]